MTSPKKNLTERPKQRADKLLFNKEHEAYIKEHAKRLKRLEREQRGEWVPGDYDGGYE